MEQSEKIAGTCPGCDGAVTPAGSTTPRALCESCAEFMATEWAAFAFMCGAAGRSSA